MPDAISNLTVLLLQQQTQSFPLTLNNTSSIDFSAPEGFHLTNGLSIITETWPKKELQQPLVDLNVNNRAQSDNNGLNAHGKAWSKIEEKEQEKGRLFLHVS